MAMRINIGGVLRKRAYMTPDREALVCESIRRTYRQLNHRTNRLANTMKALDVKYGDRVGILAMNEPEYFEMYFGLGKIGAILVPINHRLAGPEIEYILSDCGAKVLVFGKEFTEVVETIRNDIPPKDLVAISDEPPDWARQYESVIGNASDEEPEEEGGDDDTLTILYTSGTTGRPKGAQLTHTYYFWNSVNLMSTLGMNVGETTMIALPLFHIGALAGPPWIVHGGGKAVLLRSLDPRGGEGERVRVRPPVAGFPEARARFREIRLEVDQGDPRVRGALSCCVDQGVCRRWNRGAATLWADGMQHGHGPRC